MAQVCKEAGGPLKKKYYTEPKILPGYPKFKPEGVCAAIAEKVSALLTEDYLGKRARRGNRAKFLWALKHAGNEKPREEDRR